MVLDFFGIRLIWHDLIRAVFLLCCVCSVLKINFLILVCSNSLSWFFFLLPIPLPQSEVRALEAELTAMRSNTAEQRSSLEENRVVQSRLRRDLEEKQSSFLLLQAKLQGGISLSQLMGGILHCFF